MSKTDFDIGIIGGGLAGLSLAILKAKSEKRVVVFEKGTYPQHRVCGEYVSMESWGFIKSLGINLDTYQLPKITQLEVSSPSGKIFRSELDLGGFGISRYLLDDLLYKRCLELGVVVLTSAQATSASGGVIETAQQKYKVDTIVGAFGKRSNLDLVWNRKFVKNSKASLDNFVGVKYHIKYDFPKNTIALHNFEDGYCGISAIEDDTYCLCYLTNASNLQRSNNDIATMEKSILSKNPYLKSIFENAQFLWDKPKVISQISFEKKTTIENGVWMIGDSAGMITPLCGNGMSMALRSSKLYHESDTVTGKGYSSNWEELFSRRLQIGRGIQSAFGDVSRTEWLVRLANAFPFATRWLISKTHGEEF
ncbi:MAG: NAD(P)/FAD-dependent oxidoreductase [Leadbetterella sp.]